MCFCCSANAKDIWSCLGFTLSRLLGVGGVMGMEARISAYEASPILLSPNSSLLWSLGGLGVYLHTH